MADSNATVFPSPVFNPLDQTFTLSMSDGSQWEVSMADLDFYRLYALRICINYASQIGASLMLLVVLCVLTRREKRAAPVFILNASCLLVNSVRSITNCLYYTGPWYNPYVYLSHDYSSVPESAKRMSVASNTLVLLLVMLVMASLILQVRVMLITTSKIQRFWVMVASITVAMLTIGFRFTLVVLNNKAIMNAADFYDVQMILNATYITQAVSIWFFCVIFLIKLGFALAQRKKLGIRQLGPMQIIFIMGCQTMIVPGKPLLHSQANF
jgi:pheromone alpha factor receptor